ncbi:conserved hypothetical protein [Xenorhabdus nematophila F1]|uniref:Uncharacterized protein n=1 Tax=Xenorhabdus nematophila (strain ATCC 19061 / DSM 3370 / CCUG 14189 / LMG 1036 / NCIMB 9965 / AN6) TaxID=406817 RepID=D3VB11_XENNA|nr:hypothetical protein XNC1_3755 [Xenorhabdus nematophila ATCC 19061]CCW32854.1 conserved hypothetical protein [Xenorhabdus nematophila F1]
MPDLTLSNEAGNKKISELFTLLFNSFISSMVVYVFIYIAI